MEMIPGRQGPEVEVRMTRMATEEIYDRRRIFELFTALKVPLAPLSLASLSLAPLSLAPLSLLLSLFHLSPHPFLHSPDRIPLFFRSLCGTA
jgi:hypothetical protein